MKIQPTELRALLGLLGITELKELNCEEFLHRMPGYLELLRAQEPPEIEGYQSFLQHLKLCPECLEEFEAMLAALQEGLL